MAVKNWESLSSIWSGFISALVASEKVWSASPFISVSICPRPPCAVAPAERRIRRSSASRLHKVSVGLRILSLWHKACNTF